MYHPITIFLIVLGLFCLDFFLLLCFLPREVPLAFVVQVVWWCWILLTFACPESFLFLHQIWTRALLGSFLGCRFFPFITSNISCYSLLACRVSVEKSADNFMRVLLYVICCFSIAAFHILYLSLVFVSLSTMSQCVPPWVYPSWDSLHFLDLVDCFLSHARKVFSYYLFTYFLISFLFSLLLLRPL